MLKNLSDIVLKAVNPQGFKLQGTIDIHGLHIKVENRKGSVRSGVDPDGNKWSIKMKYPYGYISRTKAADGEHVDCYVGDSRKSEIVYVVHQLDPSTGKYDEDKCMLGFKSFKEAKKAYLDHYDSPKFFGSMTEMTIDQFKKSLKKYKGMKLSKALSFIENINIITNDQYIVLNEIYKGVKDRSGLVQKKVWVTKNGKVYQTTVWVREGDNTSKPNQSKDVPIGGTIAEDVGGMKIERYSDKAVLISGNTYANKETLQNIKKEIGVGSYNSKLKGWVFPVKMLSRILGGVASLLSDKGEDAKSATIVNQKNALDEGTNVSLGDGLQGEISKVTPNSDGVKYDIKTTEGLLKNVDEKVISKEPEKDSNKIQEAISNADESNRVKTEKILYGIQPVKDLHKISLYDYMEMHGIPQSDIYLTIKSLTNPKKKDSGGGSGSGGSNYGRSSENKPLTKKQLIGKLVYAHYQAVKKALDNGLEVPKDSLSTYPDLKKESSSKKKEESRPRKEMTEETKKKISDALKKNKSDVDEPNDRELKPKEDAEKSGNPIPDKKNYTPKDGVDVTFNNPSSQTQKSVNLKTKDYTDIPALDVSIPKPKDILTADKPYFIPEIDQDRFRMNSYTLSAVKMEDGKYLVALDGFMKGRGSYSYSVDGVNGYGKFAIMSLDTLTATQNYYQIRAKEQNKQDQMAKFEERKARAIKDLEEAINSGDETRIKWAKRDVEYYASKKKPTKMKRLKILSKNRMTYDQMHMIQGYNLNEEGKSPSRNDIWEIYRDYKGDYDQKATDISLSQEYLESAYSKGAQTSYGNSGTKDDLLDKYGVKVKRQNGDEINQKEIDQIKSAIDSVSSVFGNNKQMNKDFGLKISHSGDVLMHARKAVGLFHPYYNAIGVSAIHGDSNFKFTFGHEYAHFMDYWVGKDSGHHYASDKEGSTANLIAKTLRKNMNKASSSKYTNRTCECFARALEQYHATESMGMGEYYFDTDDQVNKEVYQNQLKPLIEQFIKENKNLLKDLMSDLVIFEAQKL